MANFSCSGAFYLSMLLVDVVLIIVNLLSTIEIAKLVLIPRLRESSSRRLRTTTRLGLALDDLQGVLTSPVFRSVPCALLMLYSQFTSWFVILANAVIWTWTEAPSGKIQAYLSTLRCWTIVLILCNAAWDIVVFASERVAYAFTRHTFIRLPEIVFVSSLMVYLKRAELFAIGSSKYDIEHQRIVDATSFREYIAYGNAFPGLLESRENTHAVILRLIYDPLVSIVAWSIVAIAGIAVLRYLYKIVKISVAETPQSTGKTTAVVRALLGLGSKQRSRVYVSHDAQPGSDELPLDGGDGESVLRRYKRLAVEDLLDQPIRARSLLRNMASMETLYEGERSVRMSLFLEHGIMLSDGSLRTRLGFFDLVCSSLSAHRHIEPRHALAAGNNSLAALR
ncbi:hypothetical protein P43SY_012029 [Pythium insidiosum]|uniref:Uncharacterized protein n=1 Tax=Pythium insidiosum TaxID=114742 RepID=A0AAD5L8B4_PYTIN|nr:hypothetical protein P43SY_012029 [Pythium insidiosum]